MTSFVMSECQWLNAGLVGSWVVVMLLSHLGQANQARQTQREHEVCTLG